MDTRHTTRTTRGSRRRYLVAVGVGILLATCAALSAPAVAQTTIATATAFSVATTTVTNLQATVDGSTRVIRVTGSGFTANERISLWTTAPDRSVAPLDGAQADGVGAFSASVTVPTDGAWHVTAHGLTSKREVVTRHIVGVESAGVATVAAVGTAGATGAAAPAAVVAQPVTVSLTGMTGNEQVSMWLTGPDGGVTALPGLQAERNGQFSTKVTFGTTGYWQVTAKGRDSGREVIVGYNVTTADALVVPVSTQPAGFTPPTANTNTGATAPTPLPLTLPTFTPGSVAGGNTGVSVGAGQTFVTPSAAQLTPPAITPQP